MDYLADVFVHDIEEGIQGTGVKAAFLKCAVDEDGMTEDLDKVLRAIARASLRTGRPIMAHSHPANRSGLEEMAIFEDEGVDPARIQIAHTGDTDDLDYIEELLARGPFIGMDRFGFDIVLSHRRRVATVVELCRRGYADRMHLSQDAAATIDWFPPGWTERAVPNWHFTWLFERVLPDLRRGRRDRGADRDDAGAQSGALAQLVTSFTPRLHAETGRSCGSPSSSMSTRSLKKHRRSLIRAVSSNGSS